MPQKILKATHSGELEIGGIKISCFVLEDGTSVISQTGVVKALGMNRFVQLGVFIQRTALKPFISKELTGLVKNPILFTPPHGGNPAYGYQATILADLCDAILEAKKQGALTTRHDNLVIQCEILGRSFMKLGVVALVHDAVGFSKQLFEYRALFKEFIREEVEQYEKQFPDEFYDIFYKIYGYPRSAQKNRHPVFFAKLTLKYVYEPLAGSNGAILEMLNEKNPVIVSINGSRKREYKLFQFLEKTGKDALQQHMWQLIGIGKASPNKTIFDRNFNRTFSKNFQKDLFEE